MPFKKLGIELLSNLVSFKTINNPSEMLFPDSEIISFIQKTVQQWNPEYQSKIFHTDQYHSIYIASDLETPKEILFLGHLDVVPVTDKWDSNPFELTIKDNKLGFARGSKDCKGSVVPALLLINKINNNSKIPSLVKKIGIFLSSDEETGGQYGAKKFFEYAKEAKILPKQVINVDGGAKVVFKRRAGFNLRLIIEPAVKNTFATSQKNTFETNILFDNNRHSAYFFPGVDSHALLKLSKFLHLHSHLKVKEISGDWVKGNVIPNKIRVTLLDPHSPSNTRHKISYDQNLTKILQRLRSLGQLNIKTEKMSDYGVTINPNLLSHSEMKGTEIQFDIRAFISSENKEELTSAIEARLGSFTDQVQIECKGSSGYFYTDPTDPLVTISTEVLRKHNLMEKEEPPREQEGASDARYASMYGVPVIDLGPKGGNIHGDNEYIDLDSMVQFSSIYEDIVTNLLNRE